MSVVKNIPRLRFFEFGEDWIKRNLADLCIKIQDGNYGGDYPKSYEFLDNGVPFLTSKALGGNGILKEDRFDYISEKKHFQLKKAQLKLNDVLFTNRGSNVGTIGFVDERIQHGNIGPQLTLLRSNLEEITPLFLKVLLETNYFKKQVRSQDSGSAMNFFGIKTTSKFKLNTPSLTEQQKIADFLTATDKRIELLEKKKTLLETYKKGVMKKIFNQEIRFKDANGSDFPDWEEKRLWEITNKKSSNISANSIEFNKGEYTIYGATGELKEVDFYEMDRPYISIVKDGSGVGRVKLCKPYSSVLGTLEILTNNKSSDLNFVFQFLSKTSFLKYVTGSSIPHIYYKDYSKLKLSVPSIKEQEKISKFISSIDSQIELLETQIDKSKTWKKDSFKKCLCK